MKTVSEYISQQPKHIQTKLKELREILKEVSPNATESLKWSMPAFSQGRILYTYAGFKNHIGFYPTPAALTAFQADLSNYKTGKGSIQFPLDHPLPKTLIQKIAKYRVKALEDGDAKWM